MQYSNIFDIFITLLVLKSSKSKLDKELQPLNKYDISITENVSIFHKSISLKLIQL